ncbi:MAG TPA: PadR family transcriptional regulator [Rugosimonospora sp.]|nr:PadR family transcriptional regulator [Rugosimonospora sp.]
MRTTPHRTLPPLALEILRLLCVRPMHPYEMQQLIRDWGIEHVVKVRAGSLYHTVERLSRLGLIEPVETARAGRRPERTVYAITEHGRDTYTADLRELVRLPAHEYPLFAAGLEMLGDLDRADVIKLLEQRCTALEAAVAGSQQIAASLTKRGLPRLATIEVEFTEEMRRAELAWVRNLIDDIRTGQLPWILEGEERHS